MSMPAEQAMRDAIKTRDRMFDGLFYYGVLSTGVFCRPSCCSRAPKPENLRFFDSVEQAVAAGFRPCQRCHPSQQIADKNEKLVTVARYIEQHAETKLTLKQLSELIGQSPSQLQRGFKALFGISPRQYQDELRLQRLKTSLKKEGSTTDAIYASGYGSLSRVYGEPARQLGMTPNQYRSGGQGEEISYICGKTTLGLMMIAATDKGVCFLQFADTEETLIGALSEVFPKAVLTQSQQGNRQLLSWFEAIECYLEEHQLLPVIPLDIRGTLFQLQVWRLLRSVKEGEQLSYSQLAERMGKPKAVRAVASACAKNRIGLLIPCHRVLRSDGSLGGYRWGLDRKRALLDMEAESR